MSANSDYTSIFQFRECGSVDRPSPLGFVRLAQLGRNAWNAWRRDYPVEQDSGNGTWVRNFKLRDHNGNFTLHDELKKVESFAEFDFGDGADFEGGSFPEGKLADFTSAKFGIGTRLVGCTFPGGARFANAKFGRGSTLQSFSIFSGTRLHEALSDWASFEGANFGDHVKILYPTFGWQVGGETPRVVSFRGARFGDHFLYSPSQDGIGLANFENVRFGTNCAFVPHGLTKLNAQFLNCTFGKNASFLGAAIPKLVCTGCTFEGDVNFAGSPSGKEKFGEVNFRGTKFLGEIDFSNRTFSGSTTFSDVWFARVPKFHNSDLHQDTQFDETSFPNRPLGDGTASRAYRAIKLAMSKYQATAEEQFFFRKEMAEEREEHRLHGRTSLWILFSAYQWTSNYGASVWRPLRAYAIVCCFFAGTFASLLAAAIPVGWEGHWSVDWAATWDWLSFSLVGSLPLSGGDALGKEVLKGVLGNEPKISGTVAALLVLHKTLSLLFLFLIGLALRNHFKMK